MNTSYLRFDPSSVLVPVRFELRRPSLAECFVMQPPGPAVLAFEIDIFELVLASAKGESFTIRDFGTQNVTYGPRDRRTTPLAQVFRSATGTSGVRSSYGSTARATQGIRSLIKNPPGDHHYLVGVPEPIWSGLVERSVPAAGTMFDLRRRYQGESAECDRVRRRIACFAGKAGVVLILGETGTGKGVVARALHDLGGRSGPWKHVNCAAFARELFVREMFGHERGAFTGAVTAQPGFFEAARGGTLFLDEIGDLTLDLQAALLTAIQERQITRLGGTSAIPVDVDIIAATNHDLREMVEQGTFRKDLFSRLNKCVIRTPSLRESREDFALHVRRAWSTLSATPLTRKQVSLLAAEEWPMNMRQLENYLERVALLADGPPTTDLLVECLVDEGAVARPAEPRPEIRPAPRTSRSLRDAVDGYAAVRPVYLDLEGKLRAVVERLVRDELPFARVHSRTKTLASLATRLQRRGGSGTYLEVRDLCGIRVVVDAASQKPEVVEILRRHLEVEVEDAAPDLDWPLDAQQIVLNVRIDKRRAKELGAHLGMDVREAAEHWAEVQVRNNLEDASATAREEFVRAPLPKSCRAELFELAKALARAESALERMRRWNGTYGAYLEPAAAREELRILEATLSCVPTDPRVAARAGKLAIILGEFGKAIALLEPCVGSKFGPVLRDLGVALCQTSDVHSAAYLRGLSLLQEACDVSPRDADAVASLAGARRRRGDLAGARDLYRRALLIDGSFPYAVSGLLEIDLALDPGSDLIATSTPLIDKAIARCREQIDAGVSMPWCHYNLGKFLVLRGRIREGLDNYARALGRSTAPFMIETSYRSVSSLTQAACVPRELEIAGAILAVGGCALFPSGRSLARLVETIPSSKRPVTGPVVMVLGDGGDPWSTRLAALREVLEAGLADFRGTLMTIGDLDWIASAAGEASGGAASVHAVSYRLTDVAVLASHAQAALFADDARYPSLAPWRDVLVSEVRPASVLLLALGDVPRTTPDRRLARQLGAKVAVLDLDRGSEQSPAAQTGDPAKEVVVRDAAALRALIAQLPRR